MFGRISVSDPRSSVKLRRIILRRCPLEAYRVCHFWNNKNRVQVTPSPTMPDGICFPALLLSFSCNFRLSVMLELSYVTQHALLCCSNLHYQMNLLSVWLSSWICYQSGCPLILVALKSLEKGKHPIWQSEKATSGRGSIPELVKPVLGDHPLCRSDGGNRSVMWKCLFNCSFGSPLNVLSVGIQAMLTIHGDCIFPSSKVPFPKFSICSPIPQNSPERETSEKRWRHCFVSLVRFHNTAFLHSSMKCSEALHQSRASHFLLQCEACSLKRVCFAKPPDDGSGSGKNQKLTQGQHGMWG